MKHQIPLKRFEYSISDTAAIIDDRTFQDTASLGKPFRLANDYDEREIKLRLPLYSFPGNAVFN
jgi:hypothetical protein